MGYKREARRVQKLGLTMRATRRISTWYICQKIRVRCKECKQIRSTRLECFSILSLPWHVVGKTYSRIYRRSVGSRITSVLRKRTTVSSMHENFRCRRRESLWNGKNGGRCKSANNDARKRQAPVSKPINDSNKSFWKKTYEEISSPNSAPLSEYLRLREFAPRFQSSSALSGRNDRGVVNLFRR